MKSRIISERIGDALRKRREAMGVSQEAFADQIAMHLTYYSALERGEINLTVKTLARVCAGLGALAWEVMKDAEAMTAPAAAEPSPRGYDRKRAKPPKAKGQGSPTKNSD